MSHPPQVVAASQPLWMNGGFESDAAGAVPSNWTVTPNLSTNNTGVTITNPQTLEGLNLKTGGTAAVRVLGGLLTEGQADPNAPAVLYPKYGNRSVVINYVPPGLLGVTAVAGDQRNVNALSQQMMVTANDVDADDSQVHVRFVLAPVLGNTANTTPAHTLNQEPYYYIQLQNITQSKLLYSDIEFENQAGIPWTTVGSVVYTTWQLVDIAPGSANLAIGDTVELRVIAAGCSQSGHPGHVYVDAIGTTIPGLFTSASVAANANAGADLTYTLRYKNGGGSSTTNTTVEFITPPNTTFKSAAAGCTGPAVGSAGTVTCNVGTVTAAGSGTVQVTVTIGAVATGTIVQGNYSVRADGVNRLLGSHASTNILHPDIAVSVSSGLTRVGWGQPITYTIVANNGGTGPVTAAMLTDTMPAQLSGATWTCSASGGGVCAASGSGNINDSTLALPAGASATYVV
ncbi:MAG TPA: hypothetical protein VHZ95_09885, partial [Polyangiales bacterium]|nr:hypothetical protein [Polyangiales bacterium]